MCRRVCSTVKRTSFHVTLFIVLEGLEDYWMVQTEAVRGFNLY